MKAPKVITRCLGSRPASRARSKPSGPPGESWGMCWRPQRDPGKFPAPNNNDVVPMLCGFVVVRLCGCAVVRLCGSVVLWFCGSVVLWFCGSVVLWLCFRVFVRSSVTVAERLCVCAVRPFSQNVCVSRVRV